MSPPPLVQGWTTMGTKPPHTPLTSPWFLSGKNTWQMSDHERFVQVAHQKWANEWIALFLSESLIRSFFRKKRAKKFRWNLITSNWDDSKTKNRVPVPVPTRTCPSNDLKKLLWLLMLPVLKWKPDFTCL